jgi:serine carboxypeptidase-like clade 2
MFTNECGDNLYSNPYGNASLGPATFSSEDVNEMWTLWLNRPDVQIAIHANTPRTPWSGCSGIGYDVTWPSNLPDYQAMFDAGLDVLIFSGDLDITTCPFASTQYAVDALSRLPGGELVTEWSAWTVQGLPGQQTGGYLETHKGFAFATVKAGGHEAPGFQPLASYDLINAFTSGKLESLLQSKNKQKLTAAKAQPPKLTQGSILRSKMRKPGARKAEL